MGKASGINDLLDPKRGQGSGTMVLRFEGSLGLRSGATLHVILQIFSYLSLRQTRSRRSMTSPQLYAQLLEVSMLYGQKDTSFSSISNGGLGPQKGKKNSSHAVPG